MLFGIGGLVGVASGVTALALLVLLVGLCIVHPFALVGVAFGWWAVVRIARRIEAVASGRAGSRHGG